MSPKRGGPRSSEPTGSSSLSPNGRRFQPKSSRQQYSACGCCRIRRVRCDLKDLGAGSNGVRPLACTNCKERGIKCVDEFAEVKNVKILRRGRRILEAEKEFGKILTNDPFASCKSCSESKTVTSSIPPLTVDFFASKFYQRFIMQHSLLDAGEFASRYFAHIKGSVILNIEGQLLAMVLSIWAASFGVDEHGVDKLDGASGDPLERSTRRKRTNEQVQELLRLVDIHGVMRHPTWDGVRILLLIWPLTQSAQTPLQRATMYDTTLSHVYHLSSQDNVPNGHGSRSDLLAKAKVFWYAHIHEGTTNALKGGRLVLNNEDLALFQDALSCSATTTSPSSLQTSSITTSPASYYYTLTLNVDAVCRQIHSVLTGHSARKHSSNSLNQNWLQDIWQNLEHCWDDFEAARGRPLEAGGRPLAADDVDRFVSGWQVFIFECHNVIREALKLRNAISSAASSPASTSSAPSSSAMLYTYASRQCQALLPHVLTILKRQLATPSSTFFTYDTGLVKDGCFFAGFMLAQADLQDSLPVVDVQESIQIVQRALASMKWIFSNNEERLQTVSNLWESRRMRDAERENTYRSTLQNQPPASPVERRSPFAASQVAPPTMHNIAHPIGAQSLPVPPTMSQRPHLAPLSLTPAALQVHSAPNTASTDNGSWHSYSPPSTSHTVSSSPSISNDSPPESATLPNFPASSQPFQNEAFYHNAPNASSFLYADSACGVDADISMSYALQQSMPIFPDQQSSFMEPEIFVGGSVMNSPTDGSCPHFGDACHCYYH